MNSAKLIASFLIFVFIFSQPVDTGIAYIPDPKAEIITVDLLPTERDDILVGTEIDIYVMIKNYSNNTMGRVLLNQSLDAEKLLEFTESPVGKFNGTDRQYTENVTVLNYVTNTNVSLSSFNITSSNFTLGIDAINPGEEFTFRFTVNTTDDGTANIPETVITYLDQYGDIIDTPLTAGNPVSLSIVAKVTDQEDPYFPDIEVDDVNYTLLIGISILLLIVALLSRGLYNKRPIE